MEREKLLYEDSQIRIEYFGNSSEDHFVSIKRLNSGILLQHSVLEELAGTNRDRLKSKLDAINPLMDYLCEEGEVSVDAIGAAISKAYIEEERRSETAILQLRSELNLNKR